MARRRCAFFAPSRATTWPAPRPSLAQPILRRRFCRQPRRPSRPTIRRARASCARSAWTACRPRLSAVGGKRDVIRLAAEMHAVAPARSTWWRPAGAPFGTPRSGRRLHVVPVLRIGLPDRRAVRTIRNGRRCASRKTPACNAGCARRPAEKVIGLKPQLDFRAHRHEPHHQAGRAVRCIRCGKPFGVKSSVERVLAKPKALDVQGLQDAARRHQDVRELPRHGDGGREFDRSARRRAGAHHDDYLRGAKRRREGRARAQAVTIRESELSNTLKFCVIESWEYRMALSRGLGRYR